MKNLLTLLIILFSLNTFSQKIDTVYINDDKFININFNSSVEITQSSQPTYFFIESKDNILFIQALQKNVVESNLFVKTANGEVFNYIVKYTPHLRKIVYDYQSKIDVSSGSTIPHIAQLSESLNNINPLEGHQGYINNRNRSSKGKVDLYFKGVYNQEDRLFILLYLENNSNINYDIADVKLFIRPNKKLKNIATQDEEIIPKFYPYTQKVLPKGAIYITLEIPKTAIIDKVISIDILERNGDRNLNVNVNQRIITDARVIK